MAKAKEKGADCIAEINKLKIQGVERLYLLSGEEDYLREHFLKSLKLHCLGEGFSDFNYRKIEGNISARDLEEIVNSVPFMAEKTFTEIRNCDINAIREADSDAMKKVLSDLPDYCTIVFVQASNYVPDGRLGFIKLLKKLGTALSFKEQEQSKMTTWIGRRLKDLGKSISKEDAEYLMFNSGRLMNSLIPEIEKLAFYAKNERVTKADIDAVAIKLPEAEVFEMTDKLSDKDYDTAFKIMGELLKKKEHPIMLVAIIGGHFRKLYAARLVLESGTVRATADLGSLLSINYSFITEKLIKSARKLKTENVANAVTLCAEYDHRMKSESSDDEELLKEMLLKISVGV